MKRNKTFDGLLFDEKRKLYWFLLNMHPAQMTDTEINIMHELSQDHQIQKHLAQSGLMLYPKK